VFPRLVRPFSPALNYWSMSLFNESSPKLEETFQFFCSQLSSFVSCNELANFKLHKHQRLKNFWMIYFINYNRLKQEIHIYQSLIDGVVTHFSSVKANRKTNHVHKSQKSNIQEQTINFYHRLYNSYIYIDRYILISLVIFHSRSIWVEDLYRLETSYMQTGKCKECRERWYL
jgi:hypothetical protein